MMASTTPRRSSRLKAKQEDKQAKEATLRSRRRNVLDSDSSCDEKQQRESGSVSDEDEVMDNDDDLNLSVVATPVRILKKTNNYTKVYNSYNKDYGIDTYERDFIDDSELIRYTPSKRQRKSISRRDSTIPSSKMEVQTKKKTCRHQLSSESDSSSSSSYCCDPSKRSPNVKRRKGSNTCDNKRTIRVSSDESDDKERDHTTDSKLSSTVQNSSTPTDARAPVSNTGVGTCSDRGSNSEDEGLNLSSSVAKKRRIKSRLSSSSSSGEEGPDGSKGRAKQKRRRLLIELESDNELSDIVNDQTVTIRQRSSRAEKLRQQKEMKTKRMLEKLKASGSAKESRSSEDKSGVSDDGEVETFESTFGNTKEEDPTNHYSNKSPLFLAEHILFPPNDTESSDEGDSDWIVSDNDSELANINDLELMNIQLPLCYHLESKSCETSEAIIKTEDASSSVSSVKQDSDTSKTRLSGLLLHEAVNGEDPVSRLKELFPKMEGKLDTIDNEGYTPLMWAAVRGHSEVMELLINAGASVNCKDSSQTTPLHIAAASGWVECVELLIRHGHSVESRDEQGWPPLLYAHFSGHEDCVLTLMRAAPQQLSVLSELLRKTPNDRTDGRKKTIKVVRSLLISLAHHETYYSIFNSFIRDNLAVLEDDGFGFMKHCMALLSFENKQAWLKMKLKKLSGYAQISNSSYLYLRDLPRDNLLQHVFKHLQNLHPSQCWSSPLVVTFKGEHGICSGPRREFWSCFSRSLAEGNERLFSLSDERQLCLQPCSVFSKYFYTVVNPQLLQTHTQHLQLVGSLLAYALFHGDTVELCLAEPLLKQLVGLSLNHPDDLESMDRFMYYNYVKYEEIEDLDLTFVMTMSCPFNGQTVDIPLRENGRTIPVTKENKDEYVKSVSEFKLETSIRQELDAFLSGFWKVIPKRCLEVFTPNELSLLLSGIPTIDVDDWYKNTQYHGFSPQNDVIIWFWRLVRSLKEEEKALLLKFATGSPRVPAGGFNNLQGLGGHNKFIISLIPGKDKIPQASTCFNMLKLTDYSREQELRDKILIAIRYGCEGFEFV